MVQLEQQGMFLTEGGWRESGPGLPAPAEAHRGTIAHRILMRHNRSGSEQDLALAFDALTSHDLTYVGIIQTARASGLDRFPLPYILTNCHNSLCAVGGTINEDDHRFGLSAAKKYGGDFVPAHLAVIHQYIRESTARCGGMILGSDSHTRYGALGTLGVGEGGGELVKQLLGRTYNIPHPPVVAVYLTGKPRPGVGPQDVALSLIKAVFPSGMVTNAILEFIGPGVEALSVDFRLGIDVMTTETTCLSSIWQTDEAVRAYLATHGREDAYEPLAPGANAYYDALVRIDLSAVDSMIALPFHPSNAWTIREFRENAVELLAGVEAEASRILPGYRSGSLQEKLRGDRLQVDQAIVAGCSGGTYENCFRMAEILRGSRAGDAGVSLSVYPASQPQALELTRSGVMSELMLAGAIVRTAFCGPCFGAGDVPGHNGFSIRHTTRNFPNREGSKPGGGQMSYVALMDARSIAATVRNGGLLTAATELDLPEEAGLSYAYSDAPYANRVYRGWGRPEPDQELIFGPGIADWPAMYPLPENLLLTVAAAIFDPVTTTDELIPSGETASFRSDPFKLSDFALSRRVPEYVGRAKEARALEEKRREGLQSGTMPEPVLRAFREAGLQGMEADTGLGSLVFALRPGDGSAREQAASCQKVLGGWANIAAEYATKRYRSNVVNWGMLPFVADNAANLDIRDGDLVFIPGVRAALLKGEESLMARRIRNGQHLEFTVRLPGLTEEERTVILSGSLINYYADGN